MVRLLWKLKLEMSEMQFLTLLILASHLLTFLFPSWCLSSPVGLSVSVLLCYPLQPCRHYALLILHQHLALPVSLVTINKVVRRSHQKSIENS
jgi:hypothetical protein